MQIFLFYTFSIIISLILQGLGKIVLPYFCPNFLLLLVIYFALLKSPVVGVSIGFSAGFIADIFSLSPFGAQAFLFTLVGYFVGLQRGKIAENNYVAQVFVSLIMSLLYLIGFFLLLQIFPAVGKKNIVFNDFLIIIINSILVIPFFKLMDKWVLLWKR